MCGIPTKEFRDSLDNGLLIDVPDVLLIPILIPETHLTAFGLPSICEPAQE